MKPANSLRSSKTVCVPFTLIEWQHVKDRFLSDDPQTLREASALLNMWKGRMGRATPVLIDITELLLRALIMDLEHTREDGFSVANVGLIYGAVIIRFINYVNEICQPDGGRVMSIARAVSQLNIPSWIVDVRHQASHNHMPSLNLMRKAVKFCREWLWKQHWQLPVEQAIVAALPAGQVDGEVAQRNAKIVDRIKLALAQFTKWRQTNIRVKKSIGELKMEGPLKNLFDVLEAHPTTVIETLAMPEGLLTMTMEQMKEAGIQWRDDYGDGEPKIHAINAKVQGFWEPVMGTLSEYGCLVGLLAELARNIGDYAGSDFQLSQLAGWADMILTAFLSADSDVSDYTWKQVLHACVCAPEFFRKEHVMGIVDRLDGKITDKQRRRLLRLFELSDSMAEEPPVGADSASGCEDGEVLDQSTFSIKCLKDLQSRIHEPLPDQSFTNDPLTGEQNWVMCPASVCGVLGLTAEQSAESLDLML